MNHSVEEIMPAILRDKASIAIKNAGKMKPGNADIAILGTAKRFGLEEAVLARVVATIVARSASLELVEEGDPVAVAVGLLNAAHPDVQPGHEHAPDDAEENAAPAPRP